MSCFKAKQVHVHVRLVTKKLKYRTKDKLN